MTVTATTNKRTSISSRIRNSLRRASIIKPKKSNTNVEETETDIDCDSVIDRTDHSRRQSRSTFRSTMTSTTCDTCHDNVDDPSSFEKEEDSFKNFLEDGLENEVIVVEAPMIRQCVAQSAIDTDSSAVSCRASHVEASADQRPRRRYQRRCSVTKYSFEEPTRFRKDADAGRSVESEFYERGMQSPPALQCSRLIS